MQDRNSAWTSFCLKQRSDNLHHTRNPLSSLQSANANTLHSSDSMGIPASLDYIHKHPEFDSSTGEQNLSNRQHPSHLTHLRQQPTSNNRVKSDGHSNRYKDIENIISLNTQVTKSEPTTRSNSVDYETDLYSKLSAMNLISTNRVLRIPNLDIPTCK